MHILKKKLNSCHNSSELLAVLRAIALYCVCFYGEKNNVGVSWGKGGEEAEEAKQTAGCGWY